MKNKNTMPFLYSSITFKQYIFIATLLLILISHLYKIQHEKHISSTNKNLNNIKVILENYGIKSIKQISTSDAWGTPIYVQQDDKKLYLISFGKNKKLDGTKESDDIVVEVIPKLR